MLKLYINCIFMKIIKEMTVKTKDNLTNILLTLISVFGVFSVVLLISVNNKLNKVITENAVQNEKIQTLQDDIAELKIVNHENNK